jgi:hypothetical protein
MSDTPPPAAAAPQAAPARGGKLALLALILTVALAAGGYYWTRFVAEPGAAALRARLDDVGAERDELARRMSDADQRLAKLESRHDDMLAAIETLRGDNQALSRSVNELAAQRGDHALDWCWPNVNTWCWLPASAWRSRTTSPVRAPRSWPRTSVCAAPSIRRSRRCANSWRATCRRWRRWPSPTSKGCR